MRHLLNHTSSGLPGAQHSYDGNRYALLGEVIEQASGRSFAQLLTERILVPLELWHTAPDPSVLSAFVHRGLSRSAFLANMAMPYALEGGRVVRSEYPSHFSPAAGLVTSVRDLAAISIALDQGLLLNPETQEQMLSPSVSIRGDAFTYGLGWYVQRHRGLKLEWHGGEWQSQSALLLRVPERRLSFVAVANSRQMSQAYRMGLGDVLESGVARLFLETFVF